MTSKREARLWLILGLTLLAIYATLGYTPQIAAFFRGHITLRDNIFFAGFVALMAITVIFISRYNRIGEMAIILGTVIVFAMAYLRIGTLEERTHLFEYSLVAALVHEALLERDANDKSVPVPTITALLIAILLGWIDEGMQYFLPNRVYDMRDVLFNGLAASITIGGRWLLLQLRKRYSESE